MCLMNITYRMNYYRNTVIVLTVGLVVRELIYRYSKIITILIYIWKGFESAL